jgi:hypothetical protein
MLRSATTSRLHGHQHQHQKHSRKPFSAPRQRVVSQACSSELDAPAPAAAATQAAPPAQQQQQQQQQRQQPPSRRSLLGSTLGAAVAATAARGCLQVQPAAANPLEGIARQLTRPDVTPLEAAVSLLDARAILRDMAPLVRVRRGVECAGTSGRGVRFSVGLQAAAHTACVTALRARARHASNSSAACARACCTSRVACAGGVAPGQPRALQRPQNVARIRQVAAARGAVGACGRCDHRR